MEPHKINCPSVGFWVVLDRLTNLKWFWAHTRWLNHDGFFVNLDDDCGFPGWDFSQTCHGVECIDYLNYRLNRPVLQREVPLRKFAWEITSATFIPCRMGCQKDWEWPWHHPIIRLGNQAELTPKLSQPSFENEVQDIPECWTRYAKINYLV